MTCMFVGAHQDGERYVCVIGEAAPFGLPVLCAEMDVDGLSDDICSDSVLISGGSKPHTDGGGKAAACGGSKGLTFPVRGNIFVDHFPGITVVIHRLTHESTTLQGHWSLQMDDDGIEGFLQNFEDPDNVDLLHLDDPTVLKNKVVQAMDTEELLVVEMLPRGKKRVATLDSIITPHRPAVCKLNVGCSSASASFNVSVFYVSRSTRQSCYLQVRDMYAFFKLTTFAGQPSRWVNESEKAWFSRVSPVPGEGHMVYSNVVSSGYTTRQSIPWAQRCLPATSLSTASLRFIVLQVGAS